MADEALSLQGRQQAAQAMRRRLAIALAAALVLVGGGLITLWAAGERNPAVVAPAAHPLPASGVFVRKTETFQSEQDAKAFAQPQILWLLVGLAAFGVVIKSQWIFCSKL
jgi:hypothetical protein